MKKLIPSQDIMAAERYMDAIRHSQYEAIEQDADASLTGPDLRSKLDSMALLFPSPTEEPISVKPVGFNIFQRAGSGRITSLSLEYEFTRSWLLAEVTTQQIDGVSKIVGINITPIPDSLESMNSFTLVGKGLSQYIFLLLAIAAPLVSLYAFVECVRTKTVKLKWLWLCFIVIGIFKWTVNWTTGEVFFMPLSVQLLPSGAMSLGYAPWMVYVSVPLGAILFIVYGAPKTASPKPVLESPAMEISSESPALNPPASSPPNTP